jgi:hypothetical protein
MILGFPPREQTLLLWSGARRLDGGHLQIERVRTGIMDAPPEGSIAAGEAMHEIIADAELAVISLDKAVDIVVSLCGRYQLQLTVPAVVTAKRQLIADLRDHYAHIDERALGKVDRKVTPKADEAWEFAALFVDHKLTDGRESLGIDDEATELCIAARDYLRDTWAELVRRARITRGDEAT